MESQSRYIGSSLLKTFLNGQNKCHRIVSSKFIIKNFAMIPKKILNFIFGYLVHFGPIRKKHLQKIFEFFSKFFEIYVPELIDWLFSIFQKCPGFHNGTDRGQCNHQFNISKLFWITFWNKFWIPTVTPDRKNSFVIQTIVSL